MDDIMRRLGRSWRVVATGASFAAFGLGGLALRAAVFPLLALLVRDRARRVDAARTVIRLAFRTFVALMRGLGVLRYELVGIERLQRGGQLILANHPTLIDTVFLMAFVRRADCIVKGTLWNNPFTRGPVRAAGYINNDGGMPLVDACIASLRAGNNLIVFPEGTRTPPGGALRFRRGAANIAVRAGRPVTPVVIACRPPTLGKGEPWWRVPERHACFRIDVRDDIDTAVFAAGAADAVAARRLTDYLQRFFTTEIHGHA